MKLILKIYDWFLDKVGSIIFCDLDDLDFTERKMP